MKKKEILKSIIIEFHSWDLPAVIDREIELPLSSNKIISVVGSRRAGKTYLLFKTIERLLNIGVKKKRCLYFNFEDERVDLIQEDLDLILHAYRELYPEDDLRETYFFFDEVQNVNGWEKFVRRIYDTITKNIFITGSNSKLLGDEIATSLRGRTLKYEVYPLTFKEFLKFKGFEFNPAIDFYDSKKKSMLIKLFEEFLVYGGFPEIALMTNDLKLRSLQEYFNVMIYRDIVERYSIKDSFVLKYFIKRLAENVTKAFSVNKIYNELKSQGIKIGKNTLYNYLEYLENCYLIKLVKKHYNSVLKSDLGEKKIYFIDNGLLNAIRAFDSKNFGALLENLVWRELISKYNKVAFFKEKKECDFIIDDKIAVQVCYNLTNSETRKREIGGLTECCKYLHLQEGFIITFDDEEDLIKDDIKIYVVPAYKLALLRRQIFNL
jgi:predicted AAA+ superfamily ATPase